MVVQRFGHEVVGGAEAYTRTLATGLAAAGHDIGVITSCATSYADWADVYPPGTTDEAGVTVHRLPVRAPRDNHRFTPLHLRAVDVADTPLWPWAQERWAQMMGPDLDGVEPVLRREAAAADVTVFIGYHYAHTLRLVGIAAAHGATAVIPTAHPEGAFHVGRVGQMFQHADGVVCLSPEEAELVATLYGCGDRTSVVGCPVEPLEAPDDRVVAAVADAHGLERGRYAITVGRIDPAKGSDDAVRFIGNYRRSLDPTFGLVVVGPGGDPAAAAEGVTATGFVGDETKNALVAGAAAVVQPSYMESFSLSLMEGWLLRRPALVQQRSRVLAGHARRSGGGIAYGGYLDFEAALATVTSRPDLARRLGEAGRSYVLETYAWNTIADQFLTALAGATDVGARRLHRTRSTPR